jgi:hypothetical protein
MDSIDRLQGYVFGSTAHDVVVDCGSTTVVQQVDATVGHIVVRVKKPDTMYLGLEHSTTKRMNGYVIANLASEIQAALLRGDFNPTLDTSIDEAFNPEPHIAVPTIFTFSDIPTEEYDIHDVLTQDWMVDHGFGDKRPTWFKNLVTATIGESTTSLGDEFNGSAFSKCQTLTRLVIPDNVTSIGYGTCFTCMNLETLELGNGVTYIGP